MSYQNRFAVFQIREVTRGEGSDKSIAMSKIVENAYYSIDKKKIKLTNGLYLFTSTLDTSVARNTNAYESYEGPYFVQYEKSAYGDLTSDGIEDAVAVLGVNYGGTGYYVHLAVLVFRTDGSYQHVGSHVFEDRDIVQNIAIRDGVVVVDNILHGPDDPLCCPSVHKYKTFDLASIIEEEERRIKSD